MREILGVAETGLASQSHQNGNCDVKWTKGVAMTAKAEGLWDPAGSVTREDIRHMKNRVEQFTATQVIEKLGDVPMCKESWCQWLVGAASAWAQRSVPATPAPAAAASGAQAAQANVRGFMEHCERASIPQDLSAALLEEAVLLGAVEVSELLVSDWQGFAAWTALRPLQQRRLLAGVRG